MHLARRPSLQANGSVVKAIENGPILCCVTLIILGLYQSHQVELSAQPKEQLAKSRIAMHCNPEVKCTPLDRVFHLQQSAGQGEISTRIFENELYCVGVIVLVEPFEGLRLELLGPRHQLVLCLEVMHQSTHLPCLAVREKICKTADPQSTD